jgi:hypothetical protein
MGRMLWMDDAELIEQVRALREKGSSPKAIARALGLPPVRVAPLIKQVAVQASADRPESDVVECWVSPGWSDGLTVNGHHAWPDVSDPDSSKSGIALALIARPSRRGQVTVCGYLVDVYCLGVKNAVGPRKMDDGRGLSDFRRAYFDVYDEPPLAVPLKLVQHLVFGAVEYSRGLGFEPHPDFAAAAGHLGAWVGPSDIVFGLDGKPYYMEGPYDDSAKVMRTLQRSVGADGFHFTASVPF